MKHFCLVRTKHFLDDFGILEEMSKTLLFCFSLDELVKFCPVARITEIFEKKLWRFSKKNCEEFENSIVVVLCSYDIYVFFKFYLSI